LNLEKYYFKMDASDSDNTYAICLILGAAIAGAWYISSKTDEKKQKRSRRYHRSEKNRKYPKRRHRLPINGPSDADPDYPLLYGIKGRTNDDTGPGISRPQEIGPHKKKKAIQPTSVIFLKVILEVLWMIGKRESMSQIFLSQM
jgi:hypothetical protein